MHFTMVQGSLAVFGFLLLITADFLWAKGGKGVPFLQAIGYLAVGGALGFLALGPNPGDFAEGPPLTPGFQGAIQPETLFSLLLILTALASFALLLWSVFFELALAGRKGKIKPGEIYSGGSYGLCRHPGFWWFCLLAASLGILRGFRENFFTIFLMIGLDLLLIFIQDRYTFPKVFHGYCEYKKNVPFLFPGMKKG